MQDSIPELEALRLLLEQCRHVVVTQGQQAFSKIDAKEARKQADRLDLLEQAEGALDAFEGALAAFPEVFQSEPEAVGEVGPSKVVKNESVIPSTALGQLVTIQTSFASTRGYWDGAWFTLEAGSTLRREETPSIHDSIRMHRQNLILSGAAALEGTAYRLKHNARFPSLSAAAGVVLGRPANGPQEWKLPDGSRMGKITPKKVIA